MWKKILAFALVATSFAGCLKSEETAGLTCTIDTCANKAPASEIAQVEAYLASQNITTAVKHCSGVYYIIEAQGATTKVTPCNQIVAKYEVKLTNGTLVEQGQFSSYIPLTNLIKGWINTIPLIGVGGKIKLFIPPTLGYGSNPRPGIPANSILVFDVEVLAAQ
jgi:FKBP-type peptidyl-prolyl cis-trans isomerase FkpA